MKEWFSNGYILKIMGVIMALSNWTMVLIIGFVKLVIEQCEAPPYWLVMWFLLSFGILLNIFNWHIAIANLFGHDIPVISGDKSNETTKNETASQASS